jgi:NAD(P)-dependent dehydrogenase (short-subunit alcohol dehydrogenase family)
MGSDGALLPRILTGSTWSQGISAEFIAEKWQLSRQLDEFSFASHQKALKADFKPEIHPIDGITADEGPRKDTSLEKMATLKTAFKEGGVITAANSSQISDGAAALLLASPERAKKLDRKPRARFVASAAVGVDPTIMLTGPIPATEKVLRMAGLKMKDIDLFECNEAFAPSCLRDEGDGRRPARVNVNGGRSRTSAGLPGARLLTTILRDERRAEARARRCASVMRGPGCRHDHRTARGAHETARRKVANITGAGAPGRPTPRSPPKGRSRERPRRFARRERRDREDGRRRRRRDQEGGGQAVANHDPWPTPERRRPRRRLGRSTSVNNAGILRDKTIHNMTDEMWDLVLAVHLRGTFLCTRAAAKVMKEKGTGGRIINTTSVAGLKGNFGQSNYSAAKAGIYGFTLTAAMELAKDGITVNAIAPIAKTRMTEEIESVPAEYRPEEVSPLVVFFASDLAKDLSGRIIGVHGRHLFEYKMEITEGKEKQEAWTPADP